MVERLRLGSGTTKHHATAGPTQSLIQSRITGSAAGVKYMDASGVQPQLVGVAEQENKNVSVGGDCSPTFPETVASTK